MGKHRDELIVQNLFALHGLAYCWPHDKKKRARGRPDTGKARRVVRKYKLGLRSKRNDARAALHAVSFSKRWHGDKMVDFSGYYLRDPKWYEAWLKNRIQHRKGGTVGYQAVPELGVPGQRDHEHRVKKLRLDKIDFQGKSVLDLGCNVGRFCQEAVDRGAVRVVGVDDRRIGLWKQVNSYLGYYGIEFIKVELPYKWQRIRKLTGRDAFDIVFCLTITPHLEGGYQPWIAELTKGLLIFEGDHKATHNVYMADMERDFDEVKRMGYVTDGVKAPAFHCYKHRPDDAAEEPADEDQDGAERPIVLDSVESDAGADIGAEVWAERALLESVSTAEVPRDADDIRVAESADGGSLGHTESVCKRWTVADGAGASITQWDTPGPSDDAGEAEGPAASQEDASLHEEAQDREVREQS